MTHKQKKILIATKNKGKAKDFALLLEPKGYMIETLLDYPEIPDVKETGFTFEENARLKAETISKIFNLPVLADDSGIIVDALEGQPGVFSARFAGEQKNDAANNAKLLAMLGEMEDPSRTAHFHCTLVLSQPGKESLVVEGVIDGEIAKIPFGTNGFGYDPLFYIPHLDKTMGELTDLEKSKSSHRALAMKKLNDKIDSWIE